MTERFKHSEIIQDDGQTICYGIEDTKTNQIYNLIDVYDVSEKELIKLLNELHYEKQSVIDWIDNKIEEIKPYNSELCRATLLELKEFLE